MKKHSTDQERYEHCRKCRISGKSISEYAKEVGVNRTTLRDWMNAYKNIHGKFINVTTISEKENNIVETEDVRVNMVSEIEKKKRRNHFDWFDHSVFVFCSKDEKTIKIYYEDDYEAWLLQNRLHDDKFKYVK